MIGDYDQLHKMTEFPHAKTKTRPEGSVRAGHCVGGGSGDRERRSRPHLTTISRMDL
jgi:hypothetical protein